MKCGIEEVCRSGSAARQRETRQALRSESMTGRVSNAEIGASRSLYSQQVMLGGESREQVSSRVVQQVMLSLDLAGNAGNLAD